MLNKQKNQQGVTLIEMMIGLIILGILSAIGGPILSVWLQNSRIRSAADGIQSGLQLARAEAVSRNTLVRFQLTSSLDNSCALSGTNVSIPGNWVVSIDDPTSPASLCGSLTKVNDGFALDDLINNPPPRILQSKSGAEGGSNQVLITTNQAVVIFTGLGRSTLASNATINVTSTASGGCAPTGSMRCMRVEVTTGGQVRMCDPSKLSSNPQGC